MSKVPRALQEVTYEREAQAYLRSLPLEHFMEATPQATQREITLESLALVKARRPDVHVFNELLVQYPGRGPRKLEKVVPDNMVVICRERIKAVSSYNVPLEPAPPFWVMEYVSKGNPRKDYEDSFLKYERDVKVPYYLVFYPEAGELILHRHNKRRYVSVKPNKHGRYPIPELDLEVGLIDGWVRFWHKGELLAPPAELQGELDRTRRQLAEAKRRVEEEKRRAEQLQERLSAAERELAKLKGRSNGR